MSEWDARGHTPHTRVRGTPIAYIIPAKYDITSFGWSAWVYRLRHHVYRGNRMGDDWVVVSQLAARTE